MKRTLDCVSCFVRQTLDAARLVTNNHVEQQHIVSNVLRWLSENGLDESPPILAQMLHRQLREISQVTLPISSQVLQQYQYA